MESESVSQLHEEDHQIIYSRRITCGLSILANGFLRVCNLNIAICIRVHALGNDLLVPGQCVLARPEARMHEMLVVRGKIVEVANKRYQRISLKVRDCSLYG